MAQAEGIACSMVPPTNSQAAKHRAGRMRFPPARREYLQHTARHACYHARGIGVLAMHVIMLFRHC